MRTLIIIAFAFSLFALAPSALAVQTDGVTGNTQNGTVQNDGQTSNTTGTKLINPLNLGNCTDATGGCLGAFLNKILDFVILIGGIIVILMLVLVGYKFVVAQGEPAKITEARQMLLWTIVGALILLGAKAIAIGITETVKALSVGK